MTHDSITMEVHERLQADREPHAFRPPLRQTRSDERVCTWEDKRGNKCGALKDAVCHTEETT